MTVATAPAPRPASLPPEIRYRLMTDHTDWFINWRMGMKWIRIYGPATEGDAREHLSLLTGMPL